AVHDDLATVRLQKAVEDVHQGGLACAVLAQQRMDLAGLDGEVDVIVGDQTTEALGDAAQFESQRTPPLPVTPAGGVPADAARAAGPGPAPSRRIVLSTPTAVMIPTVGRLAHWWVGNGGPTSARPAS